MTKPRLFIITNTFGYYEGYAFGLVDAIKKARSILRDPNITLRRDEVNGWRVDSWRTDTRDSILYIHEEI